MMVVEFVLADGISGRIEACTTSNAPISPNLPQVDRDSKIVEQRRLTS
jgi:hypothetical protein